MFTGSPKHRFQIYQTKEIITAQQFKLLSVVPNIYVPFITDFPELNDKVYVYSYDSERTLSNVRKTGVQLDPMKIKTTGANNEPIEIPAYVDEYEARKFVDKVKAERTIEIKDTVTVKQFHNLPFTVQDKTEGGLLVLEHSLNNINLTIEVEEDRCAKADGNIIQYKQRPVHNPIAKVFIDCDLYDSEQKLIDDMMVIKTIYKELRIIVINPISTQLELAEVLGLSTVVGNKYSLPESNMYNPQLDYIYTDDLNFFRYTDRLMYLELFDKIGMPEIVYKKDLEVYPASIKTDKQLKTGNKLHFTVRDTIIQDLDYTAIREFFKKRDLERFVEDIPYYIRLLKR